MQRSRTSWSQLLAVLWLLSACSAPNGTDHRNVFRFNLSDGLTNLDPAFARNLDNIWICDQFFDGLVEMDRDLVVRPAIAESWSITDSGRTYTFLLRRNVLFHASEAFPDSTGRRVVAEDFRYSFERIRDPRTASPGRWIFEHVLGGPEGFTVLNDSTLRIQLSRPFPPFLGMLGMVYASAVPREAVEHFGSAWRSHPVGAGPFRFFHWAEGVKLAMQRNADYYQQDESGQRLPYLDAVTVGFVKDRNAEFLALVKGELDMMSGTEGSAISELLDPLGRIKARYADRIAMVRSPALSTEYLGFLLDTTLAAVKGTPWLDVRVRRAVSMAIDKERIVTYLQHGVGTPAKSIVPLGVPGSSGRQLRYDPDAARALLSDAGYPDGRGLPPLTLSTTANYLELCEFIQHELSAFGVQVNVDVLPLSTHKEGTANGDLVFFRKSWIADYPDAENFLMLFTRAFRAPEGPNYTRFHHPMMDSLYSASLRVVDDTLRLALYQRMDSLIVEQAPALFLMHPEVVRFVRKGVTGLVADPMNQMDLRRVRKEG